MTETAGNPGNSQPTVQVPRSGATRQQIEGDLFTAKDPRRWVRIYVTYMVTGAFILAALYLIWFLINAAKYEMAFSVFGTLAGVAGTIIGFWFASREKQSQQHLLQMVLDIQKLSRERQGE